MSKNILLTGKIFLPDLVKNLYLKNIPLKNIPLLIAKLHAIFTKQKIAPPFNQSNAERIKTK